MKVALVDERLSSEEQHSLQRLGLKVLKVPMCTSVQDAVCGHPDMLLHVIDDHTLVVHKDISSNFVAELNECEINTIYSNSSLHSAYPGDVVLNALDCDNFFLHNLKHTDSVLMELIKHKKLIHVNQGYSKCSTAIVSSNAFITSDRGICSMLVNEGCDVLLLPPGDIDLPGLDYGFIGGCCGLVDKNSIAFFGNLDFYSHGDMVKDFLKKHDVVPISLYEGRLVDRGSLFVLDLDI